jgi:hypothetical protein
MSTLLVRVLFPNQVLENVTVRGTDTPRMLALSGPPLKSPVILLHKGRCLCPYTSLDSQGVINGDIVVLHPVPASKKAAATPRHTREPDKRDQVFNETLRLADTAFLPYETSQYGSAAYRQMWREDEENIEDDPPPIPTRLAAQPEGVSMQPLPTYWEEISPKRKKAETFV